MKPSIPALRGPGVVWWWLLLRKPHSCALSLTASSVVSSSSLLCLVSLSLWCNTLAFRTFVLLRLLLNLDTYVGVYPLGVSPLFLKKAADIIAPKLCIIFRRLIRLGSFPECWQTASVTAIPKGAPYPDKENYRRILISPILSKVHTSLQVYFPQVMIQDIYIYTYIYTYIYYIEI